MIVTSVQYIHVNINRTEENSCRGRTDKHMATVR